MAFHGLLIACMFALPLQDDAAARPDAAGVLVAARAALQEVDGVRYSFQLTASGTTASTSPGLEGTARLLAADEDGGPYHFIKGTFTPVDAAQEPVEFTVVRVGASFQLLNRTEQVLSVSSGRLVGRRMTEFTAPAIVASFVNEEPLKTPHGDASVSLEGTAEVSGQLCDILRVPDNDGTSARWFIARSDHLPRAVEHDVQGVDGSGALRLVLESLEVDQELEPSDFRLRAPPGWRTVDVTAAKVAPFGQPEPRRMPDGLLFVGEQAPDFELEAADGGLVSLRDLRGQVVVLDFWATWCPPCRKAMPAVQEIHEAYDGKDVRVFGISTSERGGDPAAMMADKGFTYGLLLNGERLAPFYGVSALPTFYVLDRQGRVAFTSRGFNPREDTAIRRAIDDALAR